jgi:hypothetical protein
MTVIRSSLDPEQGAIFRISDAVRPDDDSGQTLARPVDPLRDHVLGDPGAPDTIVEYGDFQCGFCLKATGSILEVRDVLGDQLRYVWRHAPLVQIHPNALAGVEASEAAAAQSRFFDCARSSTTRTTSGRPTSSASPTAWAWTSSSSRRTSSRPRSPAGCTTTYSTPRP